MALNLIKLVRLLHSVRGGLEFHYCIKSAVTLVGMAIIGAGILQSRNEKVACVFFACLGLHIGIEYPMIQYSFLVRSFIVR